MNWAVFALGWAVGVITLPALLFGARALRVLRVWLRLRGWEVEYASRVEYEYEEPGYSDYQLRHYLIWTNAFGPIYWGHWCRDEKVTRWIGFGKRLGRSLAFYRVQRLDSAP